MPPEPDHLTLVIDHPTGVRILRKVGPSAWSVLEGLAVRTTTTSRGHQARTNVRDLAADLGLSKDTVARAVNKLIDAKLIRRSDFAQDEAGRFTTRTYRVDLDKAGLQVLHDRSQRKAQERDKEDRPRLGTLKPLSPPPPPPPPPAPVRPVMRPLPPERADWGRGGRTVDDPEPRTAPSPAATTTAAVAKHNDAQPTLFGDS